MGIRRVEIFTSLDVNPLKSGVPNRHRKENPWQAVQAVTLPLQTPACHAGGSGGQASPVRNVSLSE